MLESNRAIRSDESRRRTRHASNGSHIENCWFLVENFAGREALADSINHLLLVGFYLINIGFISLALRFGERPADLVGAVELLSTKIGLAVVVLGALHFFNMFALVRFRNSPLIDRVTKRTSPSPSDAGLPQGAR